LLRSQNGASLDTRINRTRERETEEATMGIDVGKEVAALKRLAAGALRDRYAEVFGEATTTGNKTWLVRRIAWRLQALAEGTLGDSAMTR
jgi:hypothetical protein